MSSDRVSDVGRADRFGEEPALEGTSEVRATMHPYNLRSRPDRGQGRHTTSSRLALQSLLHSSSEDALAEGQGGVDGAGEGMSAVDVQVASGMAMGSGELSMLHLLGTPVDRGVGADAHIPGPMASYMAGHLSMPLHTATVTPSQHQGPGVSAATQPQPQPQPQQSSGNGQRPAETPLQTCPEQGRASAANSPFAREAVGPGPSVTAPASHGGAPVSAAAQQVPAAYSVDTLVEMLERLSPLSDTAVRTVLQYDALPVTVERLVPTGEAVASMPLPGTVHVAPLPNSPVMMAGGSHAAADLGHQAASHAAAASARVDGTEAAPVPVSHGVRPAGPSPRQLLEAMLRGAAAIRPAVHRGASAAAFPAPTTESARAALLALGGSSSGGNQPAQLLVNMLRLSEGSTALSEGGEPQGPVLTPLAAMTAPSALAPNRHLSQRARRERVTAEAEFGAALPSGDSEEEVFHTPSSGNTPERQRPVSRGAAAEPLPSDLEFRVGAPVTAETPTFMARQRALTPLQMPQPRSLLMDAPADIAAETAAGPSTAPRVESERPPAASNAAAATARKRRSQPQQARQPCWQL